ncbi:2-keto-4-pentenoate hydratase [Actinoallomurus sp. CA-150999]|uniref:2-keto-4-pentenoate hydratase n=1 Tax=Actinoallomurus sp. CA-150999 TaxID=3239887 RepID=UPI003D8A1DDE
MTVPGEVLAEAARALAAAERDRAAIPPPTETWPGLDTADAYEIQLINTRRRIAAGETVRGHKVGLTSAAMQQMLGVDQPDYGVLFASMFTEDGGKVTAADLLAPKAEIEIAFVLRDELRGPGVTVDDVLAATDHLRAAIEIVDSRVADWRITLADTVADNASSAGVVLSGHRVPVGDVDLERVEGRLLKGGELVDRGPGSAVLGNPAAAVAWLANTLGERGVSLEPGHVVLPGACTRAVDVVAGDVVTADFDVLGPVTVTFG